MDQCNVAELSDEWIWNACEHSWSCDDWRDNDDVHSVMLFGA